MTRMNRHSVTLMLSFSIALATPAQAAPGLFHKAVAKVREHRQAAREFAALRRAHPELKAETAPSLLGKLYASSIPLAFGVMAADAAHRHGPIVELLSPKETQHALVA